jgi:hypothetical protein
VSSLVKIGADRVHISGNESAILVDLLVNRPWIDVVGLPKFGQESPAESRQSEA